MRSLKLFSIISIVISACFTRSNAENVNVPADLALCNGNEAARRAAADSRKSIGLSSKHLELLANLNAAITELDEAAKSVQLAAEAEDQIAEINCNTDPRSEEICQTAASKASLSVVKYSRSLEQIQPTANALLHEFAQMSDINKKQFLADARRLIARLKHDYSVLGSYDVNISRDEQDIAEVLQGQKFAVLRRIDDTERALTRLINPTSRSKVTSHD